MQEQTTDVFLSCSSKVPEFCPSPQTPASFTAPSYPLSAGDHTEHINWGFWP